MKILIVDDDRDDADLLLEAIKDQFPGADCRVALGVEPAQVIIEGFKPQIIFLDAVMYPINGMRALEYFSALSSLRNTQLIILSGSVHPEDHSSFTALGAHAVMTKPSNYAVLLDLVSAVISPHIINTRVKVFTNDRIAHGQTGSIQDLLQREVEFEIFLNTLQPTPHIQFDVSEVELNKIRSELGYNVLKFDGARWMPMI